MGLNQDTIDDGFALSGHGQGISRSLIDGCMVIYDTDDPPAWLRAVIRAQDEDGYTTDATDRLDVRDAQSRRAAVEDNAIVMTFREGTAITGVLA